MATESTSEPSSAPTETEDTYEPPPSPDPDGTYRGSCDYLLSDPYMLVGEVNVRNTGNVGIVTTVKISWPQLGFGPIKMDREVQVKYGKSKTVRFRQDVGGNEIDLLQSWQESNGYRDGCKYDVTITDTFGEAH